MDRASASRCRTTILKPELSTILENTTAAYAEFAKVSITAFAEFFHAKLKSSKIPPPFMRHDIRDGRNLITAARGGLEPIDQTPVLASAGLYLIASDYPHQLKRNFKCTLEIDGLPVIYRGQARKVRARLQGHLFNKEYRERFGGNAFPRCLKLDEVKGNNGGINVNEEPFASSRWCVVTLPLLGAELTREFAEWGFDNAWGRPVACNEKKKSPHDMPLDDSETDE